MYQAIPLPMWIKYSTPAVFDVQIHPVIFVSEEVLVQ